MKLKMVSINCCGTHNIKGKERDFSVNITTSSEHPNKAEAILVFIGEQNNGGIGKLQDYLLPILSEGEGLVEEIHSFYGLMEDILEEAIEEALKENE